MRFRLPAQAGTAAALLGLSAFVCYGGFNVTRLGFYHDDWPLLGYLLEHGGGFFQGLADQLDASPHLYRPLSVVIWASAYRLFGLTAPAWHLAGMALTWATCLALFAVMRTHGAPTLSALLAAIAFMAFPNKDSTLYWPVTCLQMTASLLFFLLSYLSHLRHLKSASWHSLLAVAIFLLAGLAAYDQAFFLLPVWLLAPGALEQASRARLKASLCAAGAAFTVYCAYRFLVIPHFYPFHKTVLFSPLHALFVYYMALRSLLDPRWLLYLLRCAVQAFRWHAVLALLAASLPPLAFFLLRGTEAAADRARARTLMLWGGAVYLLGYLPFCLSSYAPTAYDQMNRTNQLSMVGLTAMLCGATMFPEARRRATAGLCLLASAGLILHVAFSEVWMESYRRQLQVRDAVLAGISDWPRDKTLLVRLQDLYVARKAPVFLSDYDVTYAVRVWTGDWERKALALSHWQQFEPDGIKTPAGSFAYDDVRMLDMSAGARIRTLSFQKARMLPPALEPWEYPLRFW